MKRAAMLSGGLTGKGYYRKSGTWLIAAAFAVLTLGFVAGCDAVHSGEGMGASAAVFDKAQQTVTTPDGALKMLMEGNRRFVAGSGVKRDYLAQVKATATGQYPYAVVLSCIDSRSTPEIVFDQGIGDLFVARVAGNYAPVDIVGSMEFATKVAGAKLIVVMGHTECGAVKGACDNVELGNLTTVIHAIQPAVNEVKDVAGDRNSKNAKFLLAVTQANVRRTVAGIRTSSPILNEMEKAGQIKIVGAMQDISTGEVTILN